MHSKIKLFAIYFYDKNNFKIKIHFYCKIVFNAFSYKNH